MEEKKYLSGFERYQDIIERIKQQCSKLKGIPLKRDGLEATLYIWNEFKVFISDRRITILDNDEQIYLEANEFDPGEICYDFGIDGFDISGRYSIRGDESFLLSRYEQVDFHQASGYGKNNTLFSIPDNIPAIIQNEIEKAENAKYTDEYLKNRNSQYIDQLKKALGIFEKVEELTIREKATEESTENLPSSQPTGAEKIIEFMKQNNLEPHDLALALSMTLARNTDKTNAEEHIINKANPKIEIHENGRTMQ